MSIWRDLDRPGREALVNERMAQGWVLLDRVVDYSDHAAMPRFVTSAGGLAYVDGSRAPLGVDINATHWSNPDPEPGIGARLPLLFIAAAVIVAAVALN